MIISTSNETRNLGIQREKLISNVHFKWNHVQSLIIFFQKFTVNYQKVVTMQLLEVTKKYVLIITILLLHSIKFCNMDVPLLKCRR